jgi:hypothetical protein
VWWADHAVFSSHLGLCLVCASVVTIPSSGFMQGSQLGKRPGVSSLFGTRPRSHFPIRVHDICFG